MTRHPDGSDLIVEALFPDLKEIRGSLELYSQGPLSMLEAMHSANRSELASTHLWRLVYGSIANYASLSISLRPSVEIPELTDSVSPAEDILEQDWCGPLQLRHSIVRTCVILILRSRLSID